MLTFANFFLDDHFFAPPPNKIGVILFFFFLKPAPHLLYSCSFVIRLTKECSLYPVYKRVICCNTPYKSVSGEAIFFTGGQGAVTLNVTPNVTPLPTNAYITYHSQG